MSTKPQEGAPPAWPSPWPYDFPVEGKAVTPKDKVERLAPRETRPPLKVTRRSLFGPVLAGWGAFATAGGIGALACVRFLFPNVSFEPPQQFPTNAPGEFGAETVDETWKESNGVWMVNTGGRLIAISIVCTHLGCTPNWLAGEQKFKCPCHGSGYYINGVNFEGPTPRPLERFHLYVDGISGKVVVDKTRKCQVELGTCETRDFHIPV
jgi:cytochrome b6-f complex iron-sulfur subunit